MFEGKNLGEKVSATLLFFLIGGGTIAMMLHSQEIKKSTTVSSTNDLRVQSIQHNKKIQKLEDLKLLGLFNSDEIRSIVKTRTDFEYRINARAPDKIDYLRYIKYEHTLNALRKKRKARTNIKT